MTAFNRPDTVSSVQLGFARTHEDIKRCHIFGKVLLGLLHTYTLVILQEPYKPTFAQDVNCLICANLPDWHGQSTTQHRMVNGLCMHLHKLNFNHYSLAFKTCNIYKNDSCFWIPTQNCIINDIESGGTKYLCAGDTILIKLFLL